MGCGLVVIGLSPKSWRASTTSLPIGRGALHAVLSMGEPQWHWDAVPPFGLLLVKSLVPIDVEGGNKNTNAYSIIAYIPETQAAGTHESCSHFLREYVYHIIVADFGLGEILNDDVISLCPVCVFLVS